MAKDFTLDDFRAQVGQLQQMGTGELRAMLPSMVFLDIHEEDPKAALERIGTMIDAMTPEERQAPETLTESARLRIAMASGTTPAEVEKFLHDFDRIRGVMREMANLSMWQRIKMVLGLSKK